MPAGYRARDRPGAGPVATSLLAVIAVAAFAAFPAGADARRRVPRTWPFAPPKGLRAAKARDALPHFYADGRPCSVGCRASGAIPGWPLRPFHRAHVLRAGLNELRTNNLHTGVDILARDGTPVYAVQGGRARVLASRGSDARVQVGQFVYWHIHPAVHEGQPVRPYSTVVGRVLRGQGHLHFSEVRGSVFLNPLRPGGRVLAPWRDRVAPVLGRPRFREGGAVAIKAFDPQSRGFRPVLALAGLAYRLFDSRGHRVGPLRWALRGTQHLPDSQRRLIYAPGSRWPAAKCLMRRRKLCRPNWVYRLAGGLAPALRVRNRSVYTLTAYAWDWAGHVRARDTRFVVVNGEPFVSAGPG